MIRLNNKSGFTLIEVLLTGALVSIVLGPLYFMQGSVFDRVLRLAHHAQRMFVAYDFLLEAELEHEEGIEKVVEDPPTKLTFSLVELDKKSALSQQFNHLIVEQIDMEWRELEKEVHDQFITVHFEPPEQKEQEEMSEQKPAEAAAQKETLEAKKTSEEQKEPKGKGT